MLYLYVVCIIIVITNNAYDINLRVGGVGAVGVAIAKRRIAMCMHVARSFVCVAPSALRCASSPPPSLVGEMARGKVRRRVEIPPAAS